VKVWHELNAEAKNFTFHIYELTDCDWCVIKLFQ